MNIKIIKAFRDVSYETTIVLSKMTPVMHKVDKRIIAFYGKNKIITNMSNAKDMQISKIYDKFNIKPNDYAYEIPTLINPYLLNNSTKHYTTFETKNEAMLTLT